MLLSGCWQIIIMSLMIVSRELSSYLLFKMYSDVGPISTRRKAGYILLITAAEIAGLYFTTSRWQRRERDSFQGQPLPSREDLDRSFEQSKQESEETTAVLQHQPLKLISWCLFLNLLCDGLNCSGFPPASWRNHRRPAYWKCTLNVCVREFFTREIQNTF